MPKSKASIAIVLQDLIDMKCLFVFSGNYLVIFCTINFTSCTFFTSANVAQLLSLIVIIFLFVCSQIPTFEHFLALRFKQLDKSPVIGTVINMPTVQKL